jgi:hypothetical protein
MTVGFRFLSIDGPTSRISTQNRYDFIRETYIEAHNIIFKDPVALWHHFYISKIPSIMQQFYMKDTIKCCLMMAHVAETCSSSKKLMYSSLNIRQTPLVFQMYFSVLYKSGCNIDGVLDIKK